MSGLELANAASAGAWAWKRREKRFENPFIDFLKRRWEDAKSDSEKVQYLQASWNEFDWEKAAVHYKERRVQVNLVQSIQSAPSIKRQTP